MSQAKRALLLEIVRARIFYLAGDVEEISPPAAILLRAVADAIVEGEAAASEAAQTNANGALASVLSQFPAIRSLGSAARNMNATSRRFGVVNSQSGYKKLRRRLQAAHRRAGFPARSAWAAARAASPVRWTGA